METLVRCFSERDAKKLCYRCKRRGLHTRKSGLDVYVWEEGKTYCGASFWSFLRDYGSVSTILN